MAEHASDCPSFAEGAEGAEIQTEIQLITEVLGSGS
jgi:hypothetical protein